MKKLKNIVMRLVRVLINTGLTPGGYRFDYLLSMMGWSPVSKKQIPWMNYVVIGYLEGYLKKSARVFEYGSGSSTLYWIERGSEVISIEHDEGFYNQFSARLGLPIRYSLIEPEVDDSMIDYDPASPDLFQSSDFKGYSFEKYVKAIDAFQDEYFDLVLVDGRARPSCIKRSIPKIKKGGVLVVDNSDREYYFSKTSQLLTGWKKKIFRGTVRGLLHQEQTSIYVKPQ